MPREDQKIALMRELREDSLERSRDFWKEAQKTKEKLDKETNDTKKAELQIQYQDLVQREAYQRNFASQVGSKILSGDVGGADMRLVAFCAEPSPDALSALSASGAIKIDTPKGFSGAAQGALAEAAGSIGLRTQSIQLMRDAMYRLCEGAMNGYLGNAAFETLHRRFQNSMVAILAIEQLTGAVRAPALTLNSSASVGPPAKQIADMTDRVIKARSDLRKAESDKTLADYELEKANTGLKTAQENHKSADDAHKKAVAENEAAEEGKPKPHDATAIKALEDARDGAKTKETNATTAQANADQSVKDAEKNLTDRQETLAELERGLKDMRLGKADAFAHGHIEEVWADEISATRDMFFVAQSVEKIVTDFYDQGYVQEVCTTIFTSMVDGEIDERTFDQFAEQFAIPNGEDPKALTNRWINVPELCLDHIAQIADEEKKKATQQRQFILTQQEHLDQQQKLLDDRARAQKKAAARNANEVEMIRKSHQLQIEKIKKDNKEETDELKTKLSEAEAKFTNALGVASPENIELIESFDVVTSQIGNLEKAQLLTAWEETNSKDAKEICNRSTRKNQAKRILGSDATLTRDQCRETVGQLLRDYEQEQLNISDLKAKAETFNSQAKRALDDIEDLKKLFDETEENKSPPK